ncbi:HupE/UreJ family protein [Afifella pfennigii]|uniref:HupE/UreJ family protein n=1 Tax=Afifella pfennigii TaxID=209897 RepID=UPI000479A164|nr:HupE/UreJ family protein [Afifella pfennigii]
MLRLTALSAAAFFAATAPAFAHLNPGEHGSFAAGLSHPLFGLDHILAMVAVGLWAAMLGGRALFAVPAAFVGTMIAGFLLALFGLSLPFVEPVILASVVVLGLIVAMAVRLPAAAGAVLVGAFALFHGYAHGTELGAASALSYLLGFALATAGLHAAGIGIGLVLGGGRSRPGIALARGLGGATAAAGIALFAGVL